jgi:hypothetical protein
MRVALGIPNPAPGQWTADEVALLGVLQDKVIAKRTGRTLCAVQCKRLKLGIQPGSLLRFRNDTH